MTSPNPLLDTQSLPHFSSITPEDAVPAVTELIAKVRDQLSDLNNERSSSWQSVVAPMDRVMNDLSAAYSPITHLNAVMNSDTWRKAYETLLPMISELFSELGQNTTLYTHYQNIKEGDIFNTLSAEQQRAVELSLRDFLLSGVHLEDDNKEQLRVVNEKLSSLQNSFSNNVLDATEAFSVHILDEEELIGLPDSAKAMAAQIAQTKDLEGWLFTLQAPSIIPILSYSANRDLRQKMHTAYITRASDQGPNAGEFDNSSLMVEILELRQQKAALLGFDNYAELSVEPKMALSAKAVTDFLEDLAARSHPKAKEEFIALSEFAKENGAPMPLQPWDIGYWSEQLRQNRYAFSDEEVRPYFPAEHVLAGMFDIVSTLFNITIKKANAEVWHPDVRFYEIFEHGKLIGAFYFDLYARSSKRGGAWMADCRSRWREGKTLHLPAAFLTCNFTPPTGDDPALLTHDEVITLFHEFGHGLHHMLTQVETLDVSGIAGVPWDAVELPSQFMENWCWEEDGLNRISQHFKTGEPLPSELLTKMKEARNFQSAMGMVRQLEFSLFDILIHESTIHSADDIQATLNNVRSRYAVVPQVPYNRFQTSFSHIFAGGYAAGYYSYKWAEVLSADAFSRFEEEGTMNPNTGLAFRNIILANGGAKDAMELFKEFRGREPSIEPLLRHSGLS